MIVGYGFAQIDHGTLPAIEKYLTDDPSSKCPTCVGIGVKGVGLLNS